MQRPNRSDYKHEVAISTRWNDNDVYGHVNNVAYYSYFDTAANTYLIDAGLDIATDAAIGLVVESHCNYHAPLAFPQPLVAGLRVDKLGNSSVTYGIAIFSQGDDRAAAHGHFVHVFVDRATRKAVAIPERLRTALARLTTAP